MGQSVSVDRDPVDLKDFFAFSQTAAAGASAPTPTKAVSATGSSPDEFDSKGSRNHLKVWKFERNGRVVANAPLALCNESGSFNAEIQKTCSYLILHIRCANASGKQAPARQVAAEDPALIAALEELACHAQDSCTPRGLRIEVVSAMDSAGDTSANASAHALHYSIFVWHGLSVAPPLKARVLTKAFELDRMLKLALLQQSSFGDVLRGFSSFKSLQPNNADVRTNAAEMHAAESLRKSQNRLLNDILDPLSQRRGSMSNGLSGALQAQRFPRLGLSVCRSLGLTPAAECPLATSSKISLGPPVAAPSTEAAHPISSPVLVCGNLGSAGPTNRPGPAIPKLALGAVARASLDADPEVDPTIGAPMDVDGAHAGNVGADTCDNGARKRFRGDGSSGQAATAREPISPPDRVGCSGVVPKSARTERGVAMKMPLALELAEGVRPPQACVKLQMPSLNLAAVHSQVSGHNNANLDDSFGSSDSSSEPSLSVNNSVRSEAPAMLNLEEINMSEEELIKSYDPENEENNYHLPHHLYKQLQLKQHRGVCSEVLPGSLFISGYQVAGDADMLRRHQITHVVNTAADVCDNRLPDELTYLTYYLKDTNHEDISIMFFRTIEWIHNAITGGGRVLVHCREGVSRSATITIAYLIWRFKEPFEQAHVRLRKARPICNPNTGFTCYLLVLARRLNVTPSQVNTPTDKALVFRITPHDRRAPFLLLFPADWASSCPTLDPRFGWVVQRGSQMILWIGAQVPDGEAARGAVSSHVRLVEKYEKITIQVTTVHDGREPPLFWQLLGLSGPPEDRQAFTATRSAFDQDAGALRMLHDGQLTF